MKKTDRDNPKMKKEKNHKQTEKSTKKDLKSISDPGVEKVEIKEPDVKENLKVSDVGISENVEAFKMDKSDSAVADSRKKKGIDAFKVIKTILLSSILAVLCYSSYKIYTAVLFASDIEDRIRVVSARMDDIKSTQNELHKKILDVEGNVLKNFAATNSFKREIEAFKKEVSDNNLYLEATGNIADDEGQIKSPEVFEPGLKKNELIPKREKRNKRYDEGVNNFLDILDAVRVKVKGAFSYIWGKIKK